MSSLFCTALVFLFDFTQFLLDIVYIVPSWFGTTAPDISSFVGSIFGCNIT